MADVTEVIHRITYEVNNDALNNATVAIQAQLAELDKLSKSLLKYQSQLSQTSRAEVAELDRLSRKIDDLNSKLSISAGKLEGTLKQVGDGILKGLGVDGRIDNAVEALTESIVKKFSKLEKLDFKSIAGLAGNLLSFSGVAPLAISLVANLATSLFSAGKAAKQADTSYQNFLNTISKNGKSALRNIDEQKSEVQLLINAAQSNSKSGRGAAEQLKSKYPSIYKAYTIEQITSGGAGEAHRNLLGQVESKERSELYKKNSIDLREQLREEKKKEEAALSRLSRAELDYDKLTTSGWVGTERGYKAASDALKLVTQLKSEYNNIRGMSIGLQKLIRLSDADTLKYANSASDLLFPESQEADSSNKYIGADIYKFTTSKADKPKREISQPFYLSTRSPQELPVSTDGTIQPVDIERLQKQAEEEQKKKDEENKARRKENIKSAIDDYKTLSDAAVEAYDKIIQAQIDALDKEISLREKRVEEAKKLAERGNVEALRLEEERLRKAQEQRARFARQQQIVNSAITVSNAIAAVARAALEGGGFGSAATIAALIAALAAGYAAVTSLGSNADSFADGVVGYKGKGGPRDDKNWVRISSGESIITAEGTQKNRTLLEAINQGAALHMIDPSLPLMIPTFKQAGITNNNYAAAKDLKQLEGKLDEVVGAIEDNRLRQNIFFNEQGVGIMTERAIKKERKRWM